jgi:5'(3')-deoxyribonucleotidase
MTTKNNYKSKYLILCDLDGVLVDFAKGAKALLPEFVEGGTEKDKKMDGKMWSRIGYYQKQGGRFWYELDKMPDAQELYNYISQFNMEILTATGNVSFGSGPQKLEWMLKHFGPEPKVNLVEKSKDKAAYATPTTILIDDKMKSIEPFRAAGGIGILHTSAQDTIQQLAAL